MKGVSSKGRPKCPNHGEELLMSPEDLKQPKGYSPCPVSGWMFEWEQDVQGQTIKRDINGNVTIERSFITEPSGDDKA